MKDVHKTGVLICLLLSAWVLSACNKSQTNVYDDASIYTSNSGSTSTSTIVQQLSTTEKLFLTETTTNATQESVWIDVTGVETTFPPTMQLESTTNKISTTIDVVIPDYEDLINETPPTTICTTEEIINDITLNGTVLNVGQSSCTVLESDDNYILNP